MSIAPVDRAAEVPPLASVIPPAMQAARRWLHWAREPRPRADGTIVQAKVPYYADGGRRFGDLEADGARLVDMRTALQAIELHGGTRAGLGFALGPDGTGQCWQGVDFDHVAERPALLPLLDAAPGYLEYSPSRTGAHAIGYGASFPTLGSNGSGVEAYSAGRFFTVTGEVLRAGGLADLTPLVQAATPVHAACRRAPGPLLERPVIESTDRVLAELADALRYLDADDRDTWIGVGHELHQLGEAGYRLWSAWSATSARFPGGDDLERWDTLKGTRTGYAGVFVRAQASGWKNPRKLDLTAMQWGGLLPDASAVPPPAGTTVANGQPVGQVLQFPTPPGVATAPPVPDAMPVQAARLGAQQYRQGDGTERAGTIEAVVDVFSAPESPIRFAYDAFQDAKMIGTLPAGAAPGASPTWRPLNDVDLAELRVTLGRGGFKPIKPEIMRSAIEVLARRSTIDTARIWAESLKWDGVQRIDTCLHRYYGAEDSLYTRAVGAYLFTALAGRALRPGIQADMAIILVGTQGARKTSSVSAIAPTPQAFGSISLEHRDDNLARKLRGKLVLEWAEMRGLRGRDKEAIKDWITNRVEEWTPKYQEYATRFDRRCIIIGTANDMELLDDPTGERRWLPVVAPRVDAAGLARDRDQLWAEGVARFTAGGIEWALAESLAKAEHEAFKVHDEWEVAIAAWLERAPTVGFGEVPLAGVLNGNRPFPMMLLASEVLGIAKLDDLSDVTSKRVAKILRNFGYSKKTGRWKGTLTKLWVKLPADSALLPV
jgi:hypothetical protein